MDWEMADRPDIEPLRRMIRAEIARQSGRRPPDRSAMKQDPRIVPRYRSAAARAVAGQEATGATLKAQADRKAQRATLPGLKQLLTRLQHRREAVTLVDDTPVTQMDPGLYRSLMARQAWRR